MSYIRVPCELEAEAKETVEYRTHCTA